MAALDAVSKTCLKTIHKFEFWYHRSCEWSSVLLYSMTHANSYMCAHMCVQQSQVAWDRCVSEPRHAAIWWHVWCLQFRVYAWTSCKLLRCFSSYLFS